MVDLSVMLPNLQTCLTPCRSIISWNIWPPLRPTNLDQEPSVLVRSINRPDAHESSICDGCAFCKGCTSSLRESWLKAGLGIGLVWLQISVSQDSTQPARVDRRRSSSGSSTLASPRSLRCRLGGRYLARCSMRRYGSDCGGGGKLLCGRGTNGSSPLNDEESIPRGF